MSQRTTLARLDGPTLHSIALLLITYYVDKRKLDLSSVKAIEEGKLFTKFCEFWNIPNILFTPKFGFTQVMRFWLAYCVHETYGLMVCKTSVDPEYVEAIDRLAKLSRLYTTKTTLETS